MAWWVLAISWVSTAVWAADLPIEVQLAAQALRSGERARLEKALGPIEKLPLYKVELAVDPKARKVSGKVSLSLTASRDLDGVFLRLTPNATDGAVVKVSSLEVDGVAREFDAGEPAVVPVAFSPPLKKGQSALVKVAFTAKVPVITPGSTSTGEAGGDYGAFSAADDVVSLAGIVPMLTPFKPSGEPVDLPSGIGDLGTFDPSNFIVGVAVPVGWQVLAPGVLTGEVPDQLGRRHFTYAVAGARELPVLAVKGYQVVTAQVGEVTVESWSSAGHATSGKKVLEHATQSLALLESHFGPYPYKTLRVVESHFRDGAGGMEFPGLVTVSSMLYGGAVNPLGALGVDVDQDLAMKAILAELGDVGGMLERLFEATLEFTVEHELAHQYFAMLVGNDPIAEPVVDEPLTQHVALLLMEWRQGRKVADEMRDAQLKASYQMLRMSGGADRAADRPTTAYQSNIEYAALVYGKAPLLFDAWRERLGTERWVSTLRTYVEQNRYRWANTKTLLRVAQQKNPGDGEQLAALQHRWWNEAHGDDDVGGLAGVKDLGLDLGGAGGAASQTADQLNEMLKQLGGE